MRAVTVREIVWVVTVPSAVTVVVWGGIVVVSVMVRPFTVVVEVVVGPGIITVDATVLVTVVG